MMEEQARISFPTSTAVWIAIGGALGSLLRWGINDALIYPLGVWVVNLLGSFALGVVVALVARHPSLPCWLGPGIGTGFLGGFTTFSTATALLVSQAADHRIFTLMIVMFAMPMLCALGALAGRLMVTALPKAVQ